MAQIRHVRFPRKPSAFGSEAVILQATEKCPLRANSCLQIPNVSIARVAWENSHYAAIAEVFDSGNPIEKTAWVAFGDCATSL